MQKDASVRRQLQEPSGFEIPTPRRRTDSTDSSFATTSHRSSSFETLSPQSEDERADHRLKHSRNFHQLSISPSPARYTPPEDPPPPPEPEKVTWSSLPRKRQLLVLVLARLSDPLANTSLQSYIYYQLSSFDRSLPPSKIAAQAGLVSASFSAAQTLTAIVWGTVADAPWAGRKFVIMIGLCGTGVGILGYGFASTWWQAVCWRAFTGGLNGNVAVIRTTVSETVKEKK